MASDAHSLGGSWSWSGLTGLERPLLKGEVELWIQWEGVSYQLAMLQVSFQSSFQQSFPPLTLFIFEHSGVGSLCYAIFTIFAWSCL